MLLLLVATRGAPSSIPFIQVRYRTIIVRSSPIRILTNNATGNAYDPSGPIHVDGTWHLWEDSGGWGHWTSTDLIKWTLSDSTGFGGLTGSVGATDSGFFAFYPDDDQQHISRAVANDRTLSSWTPTGQAIAAPPIAVALGEHFRDPLRPIQRPNSDEWYVGVGCGSTNGAQLAWYKADDDTLATFTPAGADDGCNAIFTETATYGKLDENVCWTNSSQPTDMMECPDFFPLGDKYVLLASFFTSNQWFVGSMNDDFSKFTPDRVGAIDFGNYYAAKSGSEEKQDGTTRRVLFAFDGWSQPTATSGCERYHLYPRELTLDGDRVRFAPVKETELMRSGEAVTGGEIVGGAQVEVRMRCEGEVEAEGGVVSANLLDGFIEVGYDFGEKVLFSKHDGIVQKTEVGFLPSEQGALEVTIMVDGGLVEIFGDKYVALTSLVRMDDNPKEPHLAVNEFLDTTKLECEVMSYQLSLDY